MREMLDETVLGKVEISEHIQRTLKHFHKG